jgi:thiol-disulfide isomerase/thioredoxin
MSKRLKSSLFWAALAGFFLIAQSWKDRDLVAGVPPPLPARSLDGAAFDWVDVKGRSTVLYFWATWCPICRATHGTVESIAEDYPVMTVALQSGVDRELRDYVARNHLTVPVFPDPDGRVAASYGLRGVPAFFVVDRRGLVRYAMTGYTTELGLRARLWLADHVE